MRTNTRNTIKPEKLNSKTQLNDKEVSSIEISKDGKVFFNRTENKKNIKLPSHEFFGVDKALIDNYKNEGYIVLCKKDIRGDYPAYFKELYKKYAGGKIDFRQEKKVSLKGNVNYIKGNEELVMFRLKTHQLSQNTQQKITTTSQLVNKILGKK